MKTLNELSTTEISRFIEDGFVKIEHAFSTLLADECRSILWKDTGCDPNDKSTWTKAVIRLGDYSARPFVEAANTPVLHAAFDALVGKGMWQPRGSLGTFPIRFPVAEEPMDTGWHVEGSFPGHDPYDYMNYRINIRSKGRCLLMLFIFSNISDTDAPTKIRVGSHLETAKILSAHGEAGLSFMELALLTEKATAGFPEINATGKPGTVYLCHPFLVHSGQKHIGTEPRFMAQPPLLPAHEFQLQRSDENYSPVELAILKAAGV